MAVQSGVQDINRVKKFQIRERPRQPVRGRNGQRFAAVQGMGPGSQGKTDL